MHSRTRIKVCGITTVEDAKEAIRVGVDAIGFIFAEKSPRSSSRLKASPASRGIVLLSWHSAVSSIGRRW